MQYIVPILVTCVWLLLLAFFASGEIMVMALDPLRLETAVRKGQPSAKLLKAIRMHPQRFLTTMLIGNNIASMSLAAYFTSTCISMFGAEGKLGVQGATMLSAVAMIFIQTLFGELIPKTAAAVASARLSTLMAFPLHLAQQIVMPFSWLLEQVTLPLVRKLVGAKGSMESQMGVSDLQTALALALARGQLHATEASVANEALDFASKNLGDVMTPRVDIIAVPETATVGHALTEMTRSGFSRMPVYHASLDEITGVLMLKDLVRVSLQAAQSGRDPSDEWAQEPARTLARQPAYFPLTKSIVETLAEMRQMRVHLAVVVDEHGGTAGLVTMEDILEELVGDIRDETDADHSADVIQRENGTVIATGRTRLDSLPELMGADFGDSAAVTLGGLMMERLGRPAIVGDEIILGALRVTALKVLRNQIKLLRIDACETGESDSGR